VSILWPQMLALFVYGTLILGMSAARFHKSLTDRPSMVQRSHMRYAIALFVAATLVAGRASGPGRQAAGKAGVHNKGVETVFTHATHIDREKANAPRATRSYGRSPPRNAAIERRLQDLPQRRRQGVRDAGQLRQVPSQRDREERIEAAKPAKCAAPIMWRRLSACRLDHSCRVLCPARQHASRRGLDAAA